MKRTLNLLQRPFHKGSGFLKHGTGVELTHVFDMLKILVPASKSWGR